MYSFDDIDKNIYSPGGRDDVSGSDLTGFDANAEIATPDSYNDTARNKYGIREDINPYWKAYNFASGKKNKKFWLSKALDWEANYDAEHRAQTREDYLIDSARQRELEDRAHTEEYNSPIEQAKRLRAAGINPDLSDALSSGDTQDLDTPVGNSTGTFAGAQAGGVADDPSDDVFTSYIMPALSTVASFIPAVGSAVSAGLNIVNNELSRANQQAAVENQTLMATTQYNSNVESDLSYIAGAAKHLSTQVGEDGQPLPLTRQRLDAFLQASNRQWTADQSQLVDSYLSNADLQTYVASKLEERNETVSKSKFGNADFYDKYTQHIYNARMFSAQAQESTANVQQIVAEALVNDPEYANNLASIAADSAASQASGLAADLANNRSTIESENATAQSELRRDTVRQIRDVYKSLTDECNARLLDIDKFIGRLQDSDGTIPPQNYSEYLALRAAKSALIMQTYDSLDQMSDNLNNVYRILSSTTATTLPQTLDNTSPTSNPMLRRHYILWSPGQPATDNVKEAIDTAVDVGKSLAPLLKKGKK